MMQHRDLNLKARSRHAWCVYPIWPWQECSKDSRVLQRRERPGGLTTWDHDFHGSYIGINYSVRSRPLEGNKSSYTRENLPDSAAGSELGRGLLQLAGGPLEIVIPSRTCFFANCSYMFFSKKNFPCLVTSKFANWAGDHNEIGIVLISNALRLGLKDCGSLRKQARFLLESAVQKLGQIVKTAWSGEPHKET